MVELPRSLDGWRDELSLFPRSVALSLGPWIPRLASSIGPLATPHARGAGAPDGYGGVARRGPYERLLLSEWLLAGELPDEFTRRAAMGEHAFLELARVEPAGSTRSVVLLDAGPSQLGPPRIAQLALLIVLARRARAAGADLGWTMLQRPAGRYFEGLTETSITALLDARCADEPTSADVEDWLDALAAPAEAHPAPQARFDDLWMVGSARLALLAPRFAGSRIAVSDVLVPGRRAVNVAVYRGNARTSEVDLELPPARACVRLLRDPFEVSVPEPVRAPSPLDGTSNLVFSLDGARLFSRAGPGVITALRPPNSPRASSQAPRLLSAMGEQVIAIGGAGKETCMIGSDLRLLSTRLFSRRGHPQEQWRGVEVPDDFPFWHPGARAPLGTCAPIPGSGSFAGGVLFTDAVGRLLYLPRPTRHGRGEEVRRAEARAEARTEPKASDGAARGLDPPRPTPGSLRLVASGVAAWARRGRTLVLVLDRDEDGSDQPSLVRITGEDLAPSPIVLRVELEAARGVRAYFGCGGHLEDPVFGLVAIAEEEDRWLILDRRGATRTAAGEGAVVFGAWAGAPPTIQSGLLVLEDDKRTVAWVSAERRHELLVSDEPIETAVASPTRTTLAYRTVSGSIVVWSLEHGRVMHVLPAGPASATGQTTTLRGQGGSR